MGLGHLVCGHDLPLLLEDLSITLPQQSNNLLSISFVHILGQWFDFAVIGRAASYPDKEREAGTRIRAGSQSFTHAC